LPIRLDAIDEALLKALLADGRKSFRAISREIKVSTPTVKARYDRLVNLGLIKAIKPEIDISKIEISTADSSIGLLKSLRKRNAHFHTGLTNLKVKLKCDFCGGPVHDKPKVLRFAKIERFFCCTECRASYKKKHGSRIEMLKEQHRQR
jgi:Lrp/AsnC family leucine-responsive transcriptional regulator